MKNNSISALIVIAGYIGLHTDAVLASTVSHTQALSSATAVQNNFSVVRTRWANYFLGDQSLGFDDNLSAEITNFNQQSKKLLKGLRIDKQGLWEDIPLDAESSEGRKNVGNQLYSTYNRLFTLARAYKMPGGELENNPALHASLVEALVFMEEHYYHVGAPEWGNWWHWQLGINRVANNIMIILYDDLPKDVVQQYVKTSRYFVPRPTHLSEGYGAPYSSAPLMFKSTGGNRTDNAQVVLIRGILDQNEEEITAAVNSLSDIIPFVIKGDGFYKDGSFIQHKDLPYSGTYGQVMVQGLGMLMGVVSNTPWQITDPNLQKIYPLLLQSFAPLIVDGKMMDMVNGRAISRTSGQNTQVGEAMLSAMLLYLPGAPAAYKAPLASFIKSQLLNENGEFTLKRTKILSSYQLAIQLAENDAVVAQPPRNTHKQFAEMDRIVHHRESWSFGVAMHSKRVGNYECINGENLKGWHTADGMTYLYNQDSDHYNGYWPLVDAYKMPGTTDLQGERSVCEGQLSAQRNGRQGSMNWTGGTQLEKYGTAGMKFVNWDQNLSAKKSWFMFDNEVIALGSDIINDSNSQALTTIENRKVSASSVILVNGQKLEKNSYIEQPLQSLSIQNSEQQSANNYYSLDQQPVKVNSVCRTGNWSDIGNSKGELDGCFIEATILHEQGQNGSYAYAIVPSIDQNIPQSADDIPVSIINMNADVHAVEHTQLGIFAANFWASGQSGIVTSKSPMSIMLRTKGNIVTVSVSNPTRSWWNTKFELAGQYTLLTDIDSRVKIKQGYKLSVELSDLDGSSYSFQLQINDSELGAK